MEREHAVHIHGCAMRVGKRRNGNATDIVFVGGVVLCRWTLGGGVMNQFAAGFFLFGKMSRSIALILEHRHFFSALRLLRGLYRTTLLDKTDGTWFSA
jgi:hypothetical protein